MDTQDEVADPVTSINQDLAFIDQGAYTEGARVTVRSAPKVLTVRFERHLSGPLGRHRIPVNTEKVQESSPIRIRWQQDASTAARDATSGRRAHQTCR